MIADAVINFVGLILRNIISLLPSYTGLPAGMDSSIDYMFLKIAAVADFFPMTTVYTIFTLWAALEIAVLGFRFLAWLFHWKTNAAPSTAS